MMNVKPSVFLDTNVLIRANVQTAPFHSETLSAIQQLHRAGAALWISRQVIREYMSVVTRPQTFMSSMKAEKVIERVRYFESHLHVAESSREVTARLLALLEVAPFGGKQVHDANIIAAMQVYDVSRLFTFNAVDFERFSTLVKVLMLEDVAKELQTK